MLTRVEEIGLGVTRDSDAGLVWADIVGLAGSNARLVWRYLTLMVIAGVIAGYGVLDSSPILVVGAMAVSPDLLPITAAGVAVVSHDARLLGRALVTLGAGMAAASLAAAVSTALQDALGVVPGDFAIDNTLLHGLDTVGWATITVAFFAGIAGMLALETRASSGVGVAISVTTIPAACIPRDRGSAGRAAGGDRRARRAPHEHHAARRGRVHDACRAACAAAPPGEGGSDAVTVMHMLRSTAVVASPADSPTLS
ncbi:MAG TPA: DUF389 domain-containing protein [Solirubrobacteraceae bacterium]|nr:DUF389 domain-containing protein [Solirubrobacteraceae bacterium]